MSAFGETHGLDEASAQLLSQYVDGELSPAEVVAFEARLDEEPLLAEAFDAMSSYQSLLRAHFDEALDQLDLSDFAAGVLARLPEEEAAPSVAPVAPAPAAPAPAAAPPWFQRWRTFWLPGLVGAAAAAALVWVALRPSGAELDEVLGGEVYVESVNNEGPQTVLISQPVEAGGSTVIWLMDDELDAMDALDGLPTEAADPVDRSPLEDTEDPI